MGIRSVDVIYIHQLRVETTIGVFDWERQIRQTVVLDLDLSADVARAAASDRLEDTLSYKDVARRVSEFVAASEFGLVETLAERVAGMVMTEFGVAWLRLRVNKRGAVTGARDIGVVIERGSRGE